MAQRDLTSERTVSQQMPDIGVEQLAATIGNIGEQIVKTSQEAKILENHSKAQMDIAKLNNDFQLQYQGDPFNEQGLKDFKNQRKEILGQYGQEISPFFRGQWNDVSRKLSDSNDVQTQAWGFQQATKNAGNSMETAAKNYLDDAGFAGRELASGRITDVEMFSKLADARGQLEQFGYRNLGEVTTKEALKDFDSRYANNILTSVVDVNPFMAKKALNSGKWNETLGYDNYEKLQNAADAAIKKKQTEVNMAKITASLLNGDRLADPSAKTDRKIIDAMYKNSGLLDAFSQGNPDAIQQTVGLIKQTSIIPESVQSSLRGAMMSGTTEQKQQAYSIIAEIEKTAPVSLTGAGGFSEKEIKDAGAYNSLIRAGASSTFAMSSIEQANSPLQKDIRDMRETEANKLLKETESSIITDELGKGVFVSAPSFMNSQNEASAISDYKRIYKESYLQYGNADAAHGAAMSAVKRNNDISYVNGSKTLMQYPPENYYGLPQYTKEQNAEWMKTQLETGLKSRGLAVPIDKVSLVPSLDSSYRVANGGKPQYNVMYEGKRNGFPYIDILRDEKNQPLKIGFDTKKQHSIVIEEQQRALNTKLKQVEARNKMDINRENARYGSLEAVSRTLSSPSPAITDFIENQISDYSIQSGEEQHHLTEEEYNASLQQFKDLME